MASKLTTILFSLACNPSSAQVGLRVVSETSHVITPGKQPVFASKFHVDFEEVTHTPNPFGATVVNKGSLHYDVENMRQVWFHDKKQSNNWCQCAGLTTDEPCKILATKELEPDGAGYLIFPTLDKCCKIGPYALGYGPLAPDWLVRTNATYMGEKQVGDKTCYEYAGGPPGDWFTMNSDNWAVDADGQPCTYEDAFKWVFRKLGMKHTLTFDKSSYSEDDEPDAFKPPKMDCSAMCPNKAGVWCTAR